MGTRWHASTGFHREKAGDRLTSPRDDDLLLLLQQLVQMSQCGTHLPDRKRLHGKNCSTYLSYVLPRHRPGSPRLHVPGGSTQVKDRLLLEASLREQPLKTASSGPCAGSVLPRCVCRFLDQSNVSPKNVIRLTELYEHGDPKVRDRASLILEIAKAKSHKRRRIKFLATYRRDLLDRLIREEFGGGSWPGFCQIPVRASRGPVLLVCPVANLVHPNRREVPPNESWPAK